MGGMLDSQSEAGDALARVCVEKLSGFLSDEDQNRTSEASACVLTRSAIDSSFLRFMIYSQVYCIASNGQDRAFSSASHLGISRRDFGKFGRSGYEHSNESFGTNFQYGEFCFILHLFRCALKCLDTGQSEEYSRDCQPITEGPSTHYHHCRYLAFGCRCPGEDSSIRDHRTWHFGEFVGAQAAPHAGV